ncbi:MAG: type II toxin-antitoxin system prevent-host-death family antitoxin [Acidobacteria bacterium]|nr:type II toxin-antitoxin system prevent-host-death family antitoxin [Acidobacteriota bacterium]
MKSVNIAELKNRLSQYLQEVRAGEEILVRDRQRPIARIVPFPQAGDADPGMLRLAADGKVRLGEVGDDGEFWDGFWRLPAPIVGSEALDRVLDEERGED